MKWLAETHGTKTELVRHFLARMFDSELSSTPGQWQTVAVSVVALLLPAGMLLLDPQYAFKYRHLSDLPAPGPFRAAFLADELSMLTLVTALTGLLAMLQWQSLFPSRRDYLALAGLPIRSRQIFAARFSSVMLFSLGAVVALNALPSVIVPLQLTGRWQKNPSVLVNMAAQAASSFLACLFVVFAVIALQGILLNVLPGRLFARVSVYMQGVLMAVLFLSILFSFSISDWREETIARLPEFGGWAPPVWFAGLHERLVGDHDPFFSAMAGRALLAVSVAVVLAVLAYLVSYRRYRKLLLESPVEVAVRRRRRWSVLGVLGRAPREEAVLQFMANTLARSRVHRLALLAYAGVAVGVTLNSVLAQAALRGFARWTEGLQVAAVASPLAVSVLLLAGFRHVFSMPAELRANWVFQMTESQGRAEWMRALERFVPVCAILPVYLSLAPLGVAALGWRTALLITLLQVLVSLSIFEVLFESWQKMPFTCGYVPGKRPLLSVLISYFLVLFAFVPLVSLIIAAASRNTVAYLVFAGLFSAVWLRTRKLRRDGWGEGKLIYDDIPQIVPDLGLRS